jgi:hypothetical protein
MHRIAFGSAAIVDARLKKRKRRDGLPVRI